MIGVVFFAATAALCVDAEGQNQRSRGPARRSSTPPSATVRTTPKAAPGTPSKDAGPGANPARGPRAVEANAKPSAGLGVKPGAGPGGGSGAPTKVEEETAFKENAEKTTASVAESESSDGAETTASNAETRAADETTDGEELTSPEGKNKSLEEIIAEIKSSGDDAETTGDKYSSEPLDPTATKLPPEYLGHNIQTVVEKVEALFKDENVKKDEYEKTADYKKRIAAFKEELPEKSLYANVKFGSTLALALTQNGETPIKAFCKYDADAERFDVSFGAYADYSIDEYDYAEKTNYYGLRFCRKLSSSDTYIGRNGFGVEKEIKEENFRSYGIVYTDSYNLRISYDSELRLQNVPPTQAKAIGESIGVLCVFKLGYLEKVENGALTPFAYVDGGDLVKPTMDRPYDMFDWQQAVCSTLPEFWVYNVKTGEVYAKYSLKDLKTGRAKNIGDFSVERAGETSEQKEAVSTENGENQAEREAKQAAAEIAKERRRSAAYWEDGNKRLDNRLAAVKRLTPSREVAAPLQIAVPGDCATLAEALDDAAKKASKDEIPRIVLDAGEYDASGLTLKTFVDLQSASGKPEDVVLTVDAASPITVDGETVVSFDGVTLRRVGGGAKSGACVEVKRGVALFFGCAFDGKSGASSATGVKAVGLKSAAVLHKCRATGFSLSALHVEDGAFGWAVESVFGPKNRFGASSKAARLEAEKCEFRGNETALYFRGIATGGASGNQYAENKRDAQIVGGAKVEVDAPNVEEK